MLCTLLIYFDPPKQLLLIFAIIGHVGLFISRTLLRTYMVTLVVMIIISLHAMSRPVAAELMRNRINKVMASDGFMDDAEEETLIFSNVTSSSSSSSSSSKNKKKPLSRSDSDKKDQCSRKSALPGNCKKRKQSSLLVPMAEEEDDLSE